MFEATQRRLLRQLREDERLAERVRFLRSIRGVGD
jgi:hypothetical protein